MANVLSLALRVTADASGLRLDPVQRALARLGDEADKLTAQFDKFTSGSSAAAAAQEKFGSQLDDLQNRLRDGLGATQFTIEYEKLTAAINQEAAAFERAARITEASLTPFERFERTQVELREQVDAGRISQETYNRAIEQAARGLTDAERSAAGLAARVKETEGAAKSTTLQFNELSGIFAVLPGPLGNIAGRISGISSASEGLSRVFAGGLRSGIANVASSFTALVNPVTVALAGVTAFAAGATAVARGLVSLEDRVERLSRLANQLGVSFEFVQTLEEAGRRADVSVEQLSGSFARLQNTLAGADEESKKATAALQRLGVSVSDFGSLSQEAQIELIGQKLSEIEDPAQRSAAAIALFGRSGVQLLPFFNELELAASDMERFGRAVTDLDRQRLADFGGGLDALSLAASGLGTSLLLPFTGLGEGITRALAEVTAGITAIVDPIGRILEPILTNIGRLVELIGTRIGDLGRIIGAVFEPFAVVVQAVSVAFEPLNEGLLSFLQGVSNAEVTTTEWLISFTPIGQIAANVGALAETISRVVTIITTAFSRIGESIASVVSGFGEFLAQSPLLQSVGATINSIFGTISGVFKTIAEAVGGVVGRLLTLAESFLGIDRSAQQAAQGTAEIEQVVERTAEQTKNLEKAFADSNKALDSAIAKAGEFGQAGFDAAFEFEQALADLQEQADANELNAEQYARGVANATAEFEKQIEVAKRVSDENKRLADEATRRAQAEADAVQKIIDKNLEQQRVEREFGGDTERFRNAQDLLAINQEIARVESQLSSARAAGDESAIQAATARLDILRPIESSLAEIDSELADKADEIAQGFTEGFDQAFAASAKGLDPLIEKASQFGNEGAIAAQQLQQGIDNLQQRVRDGILGKDAYEAEEAAQKRLFDQRIEQLDAIARKEKEARDASFNAQVAANDRLQQLLNTQIPERAAAAAGVAQLDQQRLAAENLVAIENQIALTRQGIEAAREQGDRKNTAARVNELKFLEDLARQEQLIIDGKAQERDKQRQFLEEQAKQAQAQQQQALQQQSQIAQEQQRVLQEQAQAAAAETERQIQRIRGLNSIGQQSIGGADIRSTEGASQFIQAAAGAFDPNLAQQRAQTKLLQKIVENSGALQYLERGIGQSVRILGGVP